MEMEGRSAQGGEGRIDIWLRKHRLEYVGATRHHFIKSIRDGTIDFSSVKRWLGQDYLFVRALVPFVASVLIKACKESGEEFDMEVILDGMASLNDEIGWFKKEASKWDVQLINVISQKANQNYCSFLESLMLPNVEYPVAITAFWAIEAVYQESFAHCLEEDASTRPELKVICERWGNDGFGQYCQFLKMIANRCLGKATDDVCKKAEVALLTVLDNEVRFWNMSNRES